MDPGILVLLTAVAVVSLCLTLLFDAAVLRRLLRRVELPDGPWPPVSILKPLKGLDDELLENLRSFARQDYPAFELVFGVQDLNDPAVAVVQQLRREFPRVPISLALSGPGFGFNPKVANLFHMSQRAKHAHWLISDSNVRAPPDYLRSTVGALGDARVGLVCNVLAGIDGRTVGATFDNLHLNSFVAASVCGAMELGDHPCVIGKSMLLRQADLEALGGWASVRDILAEDYVLGQRFAAAGWRVALSPHVLTTLNQRRSLGDFAARHVRWAQMRRHLSGCFWGEPLLNPVLWWLAVLVGSLIEGRALLAALAVGALGMKIAADTGLARLLTKRWLTLAEVAAIVPKDLLVGGIWLVATCRRSLVWRGHRLRIGPGSTLQAAPELALGLVRAAPHAAHAP